MSVPRIVLLVLGILFSLLALGFLFAGGALVWIDGAHSSGDGYVSTQPVRVSREGYAVVSQPISVDLQAERALRALRLVNIRMECENADPERAIFVGIAREEDARGYLDQVDYDQLLEVDFYPLKLRFHKHAGESSPAPPESQDFWKSAAWGKGAQSIDFDLEAGDYLVVVMNADASKDLDFNATFKAKIFWVLLAVGLILIVAGCVGLVGSIVMIYFALRGD